MRLQIASDLHREMMGPLDWEDLLQTTFKGEADLLVLAGDLVPLLDSRTAIPVFKPFCERYQTVMYVPGNHEYYGTSPYNAGSVLGSVQDAFKNLIILKNNECLVNNRPTGTHRFFGGTMWFEDLPTNYRWRKQLNDFRQIRDFEPWVYNNNRNFREIGARAIERDTIVVSHHLPSMGSVNEKYRTRNGMDSLNAFFVSIMDELIREKQPKLWIHGHTHMACDYKIGDTRVICNPIGYAFELEDWPPAVFVEV